MCLYFQSSLINDPEITKPLFLLYFPPKVSFKYSRGLILKWTQIGEVAVPCCRQARLRRDWSLGGGLSFIAVPMRNCDLLSLKVVCLKPTPQGPEGSSGNFCTQCLRTNGSEERNRINTAVSGLAHFRARPHFLSKLILIHLPYLGICQNG